MSLMRAFTTRLHRPTADDTSPSLFIGRAASQRGGRPVQRAQISSPVALVSTSNAQVISALDIAGAPPIEIRKVSASSDASASSGDESDGGSTIRSAGTGADSGTDASSVDEDVDDEAPSGPKPNHLSCYFTPAVDTWSRSPSLRSSLASPRPETTDFDVPKIPQRVPSHSKRAHETLHRKRSIQRMMSPSPSLRRSMASDIDAASLLSPPLDSPYAAETAQLDQIAEERGPAAQAAEDEIEVSYLRLRGLAHCSAADYAIEIRELVEETFGVAPRESYGGWI